MCKGSNQGAAPHPLGVSGIGKTSLRLLLKSARSPAPARPRQPLFLTSTKRVPRAGAVWCQGNRGCGCKCPAEEREPACHST